MKGLAETSEVKQLSCITFDTFLYIQVLSLGEMDSIDYSAELPVPELEDASEVIDTEHVTAVSELLRINEFQ